MSALLWLENAFAWVQESQSVLVYPTFITLHTFGLTFLVGPSLAISLRILGVANRLPLAPLEKFYPVMMLGLWINVVTGALLFFPEATRWTFNPDFVLKMVLVGVGVYILHLIRVTVFRDAATRRSATISARGKLLAATSIVVWIAAIFSGRMTAYVDSWGKFMSLFKVS